MKQKISLDKLLLVHAHEIFLLVINISYFLSLQDKNTLLALIWSAPMWVLEALVPIIRADQIKGKGRPNKDRPNKGQLNLFEKSLFLALFYDEASN